MTAAPTPCQVCGLVRLVGVEAAQHCNGCYSLFQMMLHPVGRWVEDALCAQTDPEAFFPKSVATPALLAKATCRKCPVRLQCLQYALDTDEVHGIWGGLNSKERRRLKKGTAA